MRTSSMKRGARLRSSRWSENSNAEVEVLPAETTAKERHDLCLAGAFLFSRNFRAGFTGFGESDRDGLLTARHLFAGTSAFECAVLSLAHHLGNFSTRARFLCRHNAS
jgi:hypothetical protein